MNMATQDLKYVPLDLTHTRERRCVNIMDIRITHIQRMPFNIIILCNPTHIFVLKMYRDSSFLSSLFNTAYLQETATTQ